MCVCVCIYICVYMYVYIYIYIYICYYQTKSLENLHVLYCGRNTRTCMISLNSFRLIIAKIYNLLRFLIFNHVTFLLIFPT